MTSEKELASSQAPKEVRGNIHFLRTSLRTDQMLYLSGIAVISYFILYYTSILAVEISLGRDIHLVGTLTRVRYHLR